MKHRVLFVIVVLALSLTQAGCFGENTSASKSVSSEKKTQPKKNIDPKKGWVKVFPHPGKNALAFDDIVVYKRCNGRNLVYISARRDSQYGSQSISVISEDKQCTEPR